VREVKASKERRMKSQGNEHDEKRQGNDQHSRVAYLIAGVGIGALLGIVMAPQSGDDTREWIATKCQNGMDSVNARVRQTRQHVGHLIDGGQQQVNEAVDAGRRAFKKAKAVAV
jgi:gas vesicle protein